MDRGKRIQMIPTHTSTQKTALCMTGTMKREPGFQRSPVHKQNSIFTNELFSKLRSVLKFMLFVSVQINDDFIAAYQANYGFNEEGAPDPSAAVNSAESLPAKPEEPKKPEEPMKPVETSDQGKNKEGEKKGEKRKGDPS